MLHRAIFFYLAVAVVLLAQVAQAVKREDFKTCDQASFCRRHRQLSAHTLSRYSAIEGSVRLEQHTLSALVEHSDDNVPLRIDINFLSSGTIRVRGQEDAPLVPRFDDTQRYVLRNEGSRLPYAAPHELQLTSETADGQRVHTVSYTNSSLDISVRMTEQPWTLTYLREGRPTMQLNTKGLFKFEHLRGKSDGDNVDDEWEETFRTWTDTKPRGPESFGMDISFVGYKHVYGIPEHTSPLLLKPTRGDSSGYDQPYRLYNLDVFEYEIDNPMSLYGSVPFMLAHSAESTVGVLWLNAAETWVDVTYAKTNAITSFFRRSSSGSESTVDTHWISESGVMDVFLFPGPDAAEVYRQYAEIEELPPLPRDFAIGHHQCRWNYIDEGDVLAVSDKMHEHKIPYDVIWLDIEHTDGKRYYTWDASKFPNPLAMQEKLEHDGHKLVTVVDPHIKRDTSYCVWDDANKQGLFVKDKDGSSNFQGWCWPGDSNWVDSLNPDAVEWLRKQYHLDKYNGSSPNLFIWNDMNEPAVFNGPEITMNKDAKHHGGWEHRDVHNLYGMLYQKAAAEGLRTRESPNKRPFVLSRSYFVGSHRYGAIWTGDNTASWEHLRASVPMILSNNVAGMHFVGADVGGFFGNPDSMLLTRWYQLGMWYPFFRAHAHIDTKRREPWILGEPYLNYIRDAIRERYRLLPYWYTLFREASLTGMPLVRPMWMEFPKEESLFGEDSAFMVGSAIMVVPVTESGEQQSVDIFFPQQEEWYDMHKGIGHHGPLRRSFSVGLADTLVFARGGSIIPTRERQRRSSALMKQDPFTLHIYVSRAGTATGRLYVDDGETYDYEDGAFIERELAFSNATLVSRPSARTISSVARTTFAKSMARVRIERIIITGLRSPTTMATVSEDGKERQIQLGYSGYSADNTECVIRDPAVHINSDWEITLS
ncbi:neutral alpha-glucosidase AB [Coemansia reversa NRRL 1564]|uniref:Glucosidase II subunit alpha n=1 Tax=Coemansia reversa (strain ATCC 12441 / NRRL 1564) TaxID=763665 RepID=A0A2G5B7C6_COERN|nr:neutral alpha-glucosidase AB [Coemansia reversa NRRL 1564]|eukprot:PIA14901.1 neutral alpha-glucosidase AB [Coemansia reversa NRRL 1564]